jgi:hypothetical protein
MKIRYVLQLVFGLFLFSSVSSAQIKSFGKEPAVFIKELERLMTSDKIASAEQAFKEFRVVWDSTVFDEYQTARIIKNADKMLMKRMKPSPHFELYLHTLVSLHKSGRKEDLFVVWQKNLESYYEKPIKDFSNYLEVCRTMFSANVFIESKNVRAWYAGNNRYQIESIEGKPAFSFEETSVHCLTREDSIAIYGSKGHFFIDDHIWHGQGGKVNWSRGNIDPEKVYAELKSYTIDMNGNKYQADSVTFYHKDFFEGPKAGRLEDVALATSNPESTRFPKFYTYEKNLSIDKFADRVNYTGGFSLQGSKVIAYGDGNQPGRFTFSYKGRPLITMEGREFVITGDRLITDKAAMTIHLDSGTIYHPQVNFNYVKKQSRLVASRGETGITQAPFTNTYHALEIKADKMEWVMDEPVVEFKTILKDGSVLLHSENFFKEFDYEKLQGLQPYNPLARLKQFSEKSGKVKFHLDEYIRFLDSKRDYVRFQIVQLNDEGYLILDPVTDTVILNKKLFNAVNAHMGRTDYDIIFFESIIEKRANASINLENNSMTLEGVGRFRFSDSQYVYVIPDDQKLVVQKDRELIFDGKVRAGRFEFFGKRFRFNYKSFSVAMDAIDSMRFFFPDDNNNLKKVNSVLQDITGTLFIDNPNNKSGRKDFHEYPIFKATKSSKVYYDYPFIYGGVYNRENFYFQTDPFTIDSLDNFTRSGLRFAGNFVSADIFPDFREELIVMDDFSLGFEKTISMPAYKASGTAEVNITLSNAGLLGKGTVDFATSRTVSSNITFFPDSMNAVTQSFDVSASALYPEVHGTNLRTHWEPYNDRMEQQTTDSPINIYGDARLTGKYIHAKKGAGGNGNLDFNEGEIISHIMKFDNKRMKADTSTLIIRSIDSTKFAFRAVNVNSDVNFETRLGDFKSNTDGANSEFPYNKYKSSLNEFKWDIKKKHLKFNTPASKPIESSYFVSTHPDQDSLQFSSRDAFYDLNDFTLYANKIPYINSADSRIIPDSGKVIIRADAAMDPLKHARIIMDTLNKHHTFYECEASILGRYNFGADGFYDYVDKNKNKTTVHFHEIKVEYLTKTAVAHGKVYDTMHFTISPRFEFKGDLKIVGSYKGVEFNGFMHPVHSLSRPTSGWWRDHKRYVPDSVEFEISEPRNEEKKRLNLGFGITSDSVHTYPAFFTLPRNYSDSLILAVNSGKVYWDEKQEKFFAGDSLKLRGDSYKGNYMYLDDKNGIVYGEGKTEMGANLGAFGLRTAGNVTFFHKDSSINLDLMMLLDFKLPGEVMKIFTTSMVENSTGLNATDHGRFMVKPALAELLTEKHFREALEAMNSGGMPLFDETTATLFISEIKMSWNQDRKAYISEGKIGITAIGGTKLEKKVEGKMMIQRKKSGDEITFYFQTDNDNWYYINFLRRNLYVYSSNDAFNNGIREYYSQVSTDQYNLKLATPRAKTKFLNSFEKKNENMPSPQEEDPEEGEEGNN